jgi:hypothetical protein
MSTPSTPSPTTPEVKTKPLITVKVINRKLAEQIPSGNYQTPKRGDLIGFIPTTSDFLYRERETGHLRTIKAHLLTDHYAGNNGHDWKAAQAEVEKLQASTDEIYLG